MTYVIAEPCVNTKDTACVEVCPVDCIHPKKDEPEFEAETKLYIDPETCIDCGAGVRPIDRFCSQCGRRDPTGTDDSLLSEPTLVTDGPTEPEQPTLMKAPSGGHVRMNTESPRSMLVPGFGLGLLIGVVYAVAMSVPIFTDPLRRGLHDKWSDTIVVKVG